MFFNKPPLPLPLPYTLHKQSWYIAMPVCDFSKWAGTPDPESISFKTTIVGNWGVLDKELLLTLVIILESQAKLDLMVNIRLCTEAA